MTLIYFILILGTTIFIHELGHFLFAKKTGIYVYEFSLGMGPKIWGFKRKNDETDYNLRLFPIGGFVQMAGEEIDEDEDIPKNKRFQTKGWFQKAIVVVAGVTFNFLLAILILFILGLINGAPSRTPVIDEVLKDTPASKVLKQGDIIKSVNGKSTTTIDMVTLELSILKQSNVEFVVERHNKLIELQVKAVKEDGRYVCGFTFDQDVSHGILASIKYAFTKFIDLTHQIIRVVCYLFTGRLGLNSLSGPIGIYRTVGETSKTGILNLVYFLAYISVNVGIVNLLPFPAFDGGRLFFMIIEKIIGKPINAKVENIIHYIGFVLIIILMIIITYQDIVRLITK